MDGSVSRWRRIAAAFATHSSFPAFNHRFFCALAASLGAGIVLAFPEARSDDGVTAAAASLASWKRRVGGDYLRVRDRSHFARF